MPTRAFPATVLALAAFLLTGCGAEAEPGRRNAAAAPAPADTAPAAPAAVADSAAGVAEAAVVADTGRVAPPDTGRAPAPAAADPGTVAVAPEGAVRDSAPARRAALDDRWPVKGPPPLPGSILPGRRIVAYYGNPLSKRMGILGEIPPDRMLERLDREVARWEEADPATPVQPALHLVAVVAQGSPGRDGKWRTKMPDSLIATVVEWATRRDALVFLDVQVGLSTLQAELPRLERWLALPNVHLGIDPEFSMKGGHPPGTRIGTFDARDVNYASSFLQELVTKHSLPPKVLVVHRFTRAMVTNTRDIRLDPRVQIVIQMDGWGPPQLKRDSYRLFVQNEPVQFTGFKLFYKNDTKRGHPLMTPEQILELYPAPVYIQYQ